MPLILLLSFLTLAVLGRVLIQYRLTGDHGIRLPSLAAPLTVKLASLLLLLGFVALLVVVTLEAMDDLKPDLSLPAHANMAGLMLALAGMGITVLAQWQMGRAWRVGVDESEHTELVSTGLYARIRNPIYTGIFLFGAGLMLIFPNLSLLLSVLLLSVSIDLQVRYAEEPYLIKEHGQAFLDYRQRTGRYFPKLF